LSTLTKVFVVLLVISSIAFTSMTVSIASQTANWKQVAERYQQHAAVADTNLRNLIAANSAELASAADAINDHMERIAQLEGELQSQENEAERLAAELRRTAAEKSNVEAMNKGLLTQLSNATATRDEYRQQRNDLESQVIDLQQRNIDLNDRVNELTTRVAVLLEQKQQAQEQLGSRRPGGASMPKATPPTALGDVRSVSPTTTPAIRGKVVEVAGDVVTVSVGSADGVEKEMVFVIHRGNEYIGDVKISVVDPDRAAGKLIRSRLVPSPGDQATDALAMSRTRG